MSIPEKLNQPFGKEEEANFDPERRKFAKLALVGVLGGTAWLSQPRRSAAKLGDIPPA